MFSCLLKSHPSFASCFPTNAALEVQCVIMEQDILLFVYFANCSLNTFQDRAAAEAVPQHIVPLSFCRSPTFHKLGASSDNQTPHSQSKEKLIHRLTFRDDSVLLNNCIFTVCLCCRIAAAALLVHFWLVHGAQ